MNGIHQIAAMCFFYIFIRMPSRDALSARTSLTSSPRSFQGKKLTSYCQMVNYLLNMCITDDINAATDADTIDYKQPQDLNTIDYSHLLWTKALRCGHVYSEYPLQGTFIERLCSSIWQSMESYFAKIKGASLQKLSWHLLSLTRLQFRSSPSEKPKPDCNRGRDGEGALNV